VGRENRVHQDRVSMEILIAAAILGIIPGIIAERKGRIGVLWWLFGTVAFVIALPAALMLSPTAEAIRENKRKEGRVPCPNCAEYIMPAAKECPFCGHVL
jgi:hypothetical protein